MPKVTEEYLVEKKNGILDCAMEIMKEKPLYQITMRDLIKKLGVSQGVIYRYYSGLDEILLDLMNRETGDISVIDTINEILIRDCSESEKLKLLFLELGRYIVKVQDKIGGKFYFEFLVHLAFDPKNQVEVLPKLIYKQNLMTVQGMMIQFIDEKIKEGAFNPTATMEAIISYASVTIDGISNDYALYSGNQKETALMEVKPEELFGMLADSVLHYLGR